MPSATDKDRACPVGKSTPISTGRMMMPNEVMEAPYKRAYELSAMMNMYFWKVVPSYLCWPRVSNGEASVTAADPDDGGSASVVVSGI